MPNLDSDKAVANVSARAALRGVVVRTIENGGGRPRTFLVTRPDWPTWPGRECATLDVVARVLGQIDGEDGR